MLFVGFQVIFNQHFLNTDFFKSDSMIILKQIHTMTKLNPPNLFYCQSRKYLQEENNFLEINSLFEKAVAKSTSINTKLNKEDLLMLHSLYNQATKGDFDFDTSNKIIDVTKAEFQAWASLKGKSIKDAQSEYIVLVYELKI